MARLSTIILSALLTLSLGAVNAVPIEDSIRIKTDGPVVPHNDPRAGGAGSATWTYEGLGACGKVSTNTDLVVGVPAEFFDGWPGYWGNPVANPLCGKQIFAIHQGLKVVATVVDRNSGPNENDLVFSPAAFSMISRGEKDKVQAVMWHVVE